MTSKLLRQRSAMENIFEKTGIVNPHVLGALPATCIAVEKSVGEVYNSSCPVSSTKSAFWADRFPS